MFETRTKRTNNFPPNHARLQFEEKKYIVLCLAENLVQEMHRILPSKLSEASSTSRHIARREQFVGKLPKVKFAIGEVSKSGVSNIDWQQNFKQTKYIHKI